MHSRGPLPSTEPSPATLPDLLRRGLDVAFVGINPSLYSVEKGHYFARPTNRFWRAFSQSRLSAAARRGLGVETLRPEHDRLLLDYKFGFTDAVKRATARATELQPSEFARSVESLIAKMEEFQPRIACFHGITAYRQVHRVLARATAAPQLGLQSVAIGETRIFLAPNPSPANAHFTLAEQSAWYDRLAAHLN